MKARLTEDVLAALDACHSEGSLLYLPPGEMERNLYLKVKKVLEGLGGKWKRGKGAFEFDRDISGDLSGIVDSGSFISDKVKYQYYPTPEALARRMVSIAGIQPGESVLEPSAGQGAIARFVPGCDCVELHPGNREILARRGFHVVGEDFMTWAPAKEYDVVIMNPPFTGGQDAAHVLKAIGMARRKVVAIVSNAVNTSRRAVYRDLREALSDDRLKVGIELLESDTFRQSGANVHTLLLTVEKTTSEHENSD